MVSEICVIIKDDDKNLRTKFLIYEEYKVSEDDPVIKDCIDKSLQNFDGDPTDIQIKISMDVL